jgi:hypothetical protein
MPYGIKKRGDQYAIVQKLPGGKTRTVGHSDEKVKAQMSAHIRESQDAKAAKR